MSRTALPLLRLLQSADTAFPSGAFAFSSGLETLANEGRVRGAAEVQEVLFTQIVPRWLSFDRPFLHGAHTGADDPSRLIEIDGDCHVQNTTDRLAEASRRVGRSLLSVHARIGTPRVAAYRATLAEARRPDATGYEPVVQGLVGAGLGLTPAETEAGALHSVVMAFVSAAVRLGRAGAIEAQAVLANVAPAMAEGLARPVPERPGAFAPFAEIAAMRRATDHASLFST
ncbi:MAG: urease accessory protein UreF [Pseudooceanicola nanhaiensis]